MFALLHGICRPGCVDSSRNGTLTPALSQEERENLVLGEPVRMGHKIALVEIAPGQPVIKYGQIIGFASRPIAPGQWVHTHNVDAGAFARDYAKSTAVPPAPQPLAGYTFQGFRRADGRVGTRNYVAVISNVNCSASVSKYIARRFDAAALHEFPNVDGVVAFTYGGGCGIPYGGEYHQILTRVLGGMARHPNIGGYVLVGLGCETNTIGHLIDEQRLVQIDGDFATAGGSTPRQNRGLGSSRGPAVLVMQDLGGTAKTVEAGVKLVAELLPRVNALRRETVPASEIFLGTNCGGSDGNSGITANPALGVASDHDRRLRRHDDPGRDDRNLRGRATSDLPRQNAGRRRQVDRTHQMVGMVQRRVRRDLR